MPKLKFYQKYWYFLGADCNKLFTAHSLQPVPVSILTLHKDHLAIGETGIKLKLWATNALLRDGSAEVSIF